MVVEEDVAELVGGLLLGADVDLGLLAEVLVAGVVDPGGEEGFEALVVEYCDKPSSAQGVSSR